MLEKERFWLAMKIPKIIFLITFFSLISITMISPNNLLGKENDILNEKQIIRMAEKNFSSITTLEATFIQIASDGNIENGKLYFRRPFQLRIDYKEPLNLSLAGALMDRPQTMASAGA